MNELFQIKSNNTSSLHISDLFITRYDSNHSVENLLGPHKDKTPFSFVIPINSDFEGGGTYFFETQELWRPPLGSALMFNGQLLHG